jgi:hypothetical protein
MMYLILTKEIVKRVMTGKKGQRLMVILFSKGQLPVCHVVVHFRLLPFHSGAGY